MPELYKIHLTNEIKIRTSYGMHTNFKNNHALHGNETMQLLEYYKCTRPVKNIIDFSSNINANGPFTGLLTELNRHLKCIATYPQEHQYAQLRENLAQIEELLPNHIVLGNGANQLIYYAVVLARELGIKRALIPMPSYSEYEYASQIYKMQIERFTVFSLFNQSNEKSMKNLLHTPSIVFLANPNNPTGESINTAHIYECLEQYKDSFFVIDESFVDFRPENSFLTNAIKEKLPDNLILIKSFTKFYGVPGLRLAYAIASEKISRDLHSYLPTWSVGTLPLAAGLYISKAQQNRDMAWLDYNQKSRAHSHKWNQLFCERLNISSKLECFPSQANFHLLHFSHLTNQEWGGYQIGRKLAQDYGIVIRPCFNFHGLDENIARIAIRNDKMNEHLIECIHELLQEKSPQKTIVSKHKKKLRIPRLMFQGTGSNVGKTMFVAAFVRHLTNEGFRVAPFKAQNMSLNSYVSYKGEEMAVAQMIQARAARISPDARMNPILLKPTSNQSSKVIVLGNCTHTMNAKEYEKYKMSLFSQVIQTYRSLEEEFDFIVIEGAGSPAEVNLMQTDLGNMQLAKAVDSPVILIGDIDKGGVFAALLGTLHIFNEEERKLVMGYVINKFRGDPSLLESAFEYIKDRSSKEHLGTVPYTNIELPQEDSVNFHEKFKPRQNALLHIGLVEFPYLSNFTDFECLLEIEEVSVHIINEKSKEKLYNMHAIILPGTHQSMQALHFLKETGIAQIIADIAENHRQIEIIGICGGLQVLGHNIYDEKSIESHTKQSAALGLLEIDTHFVPKKTLTNLKEVTHKASNTRIDAYEIHYGQIKILSENVLPIFSYTINQDYILGVECQEKNVWGTFLHGIFENTEFLNFLLNALAKRNELNVHFALQSTHESFESKIDKWTEHITQHVDIKKIMHSLGY